ncbi:MAG: hypothetical protein V4727_10050 [Verrucomicrobiota bacterium]
MNLGWRISNCNFTADDGSLPGIDFTCLTPESVRAITDHFFRFGKLLHEDATFWDNRIEQDVKISQVVDLGELVTSGAASSFHCCFTGISWNNVELPVLGLFVFEDSIEIDYRMGKEWLPEKVNAFFELLAHFISIAPETLVKSTECEGLRDPENFYEALDHYAPDRKRG